MIFISTHAPARGATEIALAEEAVQNLFLLTPLREGRRKTSIKLEDGKLFLLTPLREGRPLVMQWELQLSSYFYSRPCGRGDN